MQYMQEQQACIMWSKMGFKDKLIYNYVTLCGLGTLPGGGTWASLLELCLVLWSP